MKLKSEDTKDIFSVVEEFLECFLFLLLHVSVSCFLMFLNLIMKKSAVWYEMKLLFLPFFLPLHLHAGAPDETSLSFQDASRLNHQQLKTFRSGLI